MRLSVTKSMKQVFLLIHDKGQYLLNQGLPLGEHVLVINVDQVTGKDSLYYASYKIERKRKVMLNMGRGSGRECDPSNQQSLDACLQEYTIRQGCHYPMRDSFQVRTRQVRRPFGGTSLFGTWNIMST